MAIFGGLTLLTRRMCGMKTGIFAGRDRERVALTDQHTLQVVEIGGVRLLIGTGPSGAPVVLKELGEVEQDVRVEEERLGWLGVLGGR